MKTYLVFTKKADGDKFERPGFSTDFIVKLETLSRKQEHIAEYSLNLRFVICNIFVV